MQSKKLGLCICYNIQNFGSALQSLATTRILESMRISYEIIRYKKGLKFYFGILPRLFNCIFLFDNLERLRKKIALVFHKNFRENERIRKSAFADFISDNFHNFSPVFNGYSALKKGAENYTAFLSGSDQLWNPAGLPTNFYNLNFAPNNSLKVSYSSSFGVTKIPFYQVERTKKFLKRFDFISVRENAGAEIVKRLINKEVPIVADPTLLLTKEEWEQAIPNKIPCSEPYIFAYFLGSNLEHRRAVLELKEKTKLKIIALRHLDGYVEFDENFGDCAPYDINPNVFVNLIRNAEYICTDSFHGTIFSILHHKRFLTFSRYSNGKYSKNSRIESLLKNLGIEDFNSIDYKEVDIKIKKLREKSLAYLEETLKCLM